MLKYFLKESLTLRGQMRVILHTVKDQDIKFDSGWIKNVLPIVGRSALAGVLTGKNLTSNPGQVTFCAVGDGVVIPNINGVQLDNELDRVNISTISQPVGTEAQIRAFFTSSEGNGDLTEIGMFGEDATAAADSGTFFQWVAITLTKTSAETMTILSKIPFNYLEV